MNIIARITFTVLRVKFFGVVTVLVVKVGLKMMTNKRQQKRREKEKERERVERKEVRKRIKKTRQVPVVQLMLFRIQRRRTLVRMKPCRWTLAPPHLGQLLRRVVVKTVTRNRQF